MCGKEKVKESKKERRCRKPKQWLQTMSGTYFGRRKHQPYMAAAELNS
jgi:hypothetical protein